jgi:hypothetical protein
MTIKDLEKIREEMKSLTANLKKSHHPVLRLVLSQTFYELSHRFYGQIKTRS